MMFLVVMNNLLLLLPLLLASLCGVTDAWMTPLTTTTRLFLGTSSSSNRGVCFAIRSNSHLWSSSSTSEENPPEQETTTSINDSSKSMVIEEEETTVTTTNTNTDEEDDWEYVEYEVLTEADLMNTEWLVGTNWLNDKQKIKETWCRLVTNERGENIAYWGDKAQGKWNLDVASQFLTISKETWGGWGGKKIWAGTIDDYYYLQGTVRGWSFFSPASVLGQWQAKRLGLDDSEDPGIAPWFQEGYGKEREQQVREAAEKRQVDEEGIFKYFPGSKL